MNNYPPALPDGVISENYPAAPADDRRAAEMLKWGDKDPSGGQAKGSLGTLLVHPGRLTFIVTWHCPIAQCFTGEAEKTAMKERFQELEMTVDNSDMLIACRPKDLPPRNAHVKDKRDSKSHPDS
jgi:hypothetical protein